MAAKSGPSGRPAALVLAGGLSRRMGGGDKSLILLARRPLLAHVLGRLAAQTTDIAISANGDPARFADFGRPVLADTIEGHLGPLAGLLAGMVWAKELGSTAVVSVPTDSPFIPTNLVARLAKAATTRPDIPLLAASAGKRHPTVGLWPVRLAGRLLEFLASGTTYKVTAFADSNGATTLDFPPAAIAGAAVDPFFNVNTPDDLAEAEALLARAPR